MILLGVRTIKAERFITQLYDGVILFNVFNMLKSIIYLDMFNLRHIMYFTCFTLAFHNFKRIQLFCLLLRYGNTHDSIEC